MTAKKRNWLYIKEIRQSTDLGNSPDTNKYSIPSSIDTEIVLSDGSILGGVMSATWKASIDETFNEISLRILQTENIKIDLTLARQYYQLGSIEPTK